MALVGKAIPLVFNTLSRLVIAFLPRSTRLLDFRYTVAIHNDFIAEDEEICHCFHLFPLYFPWSDGTRCHDLSFLILSFKPAFSLSSFTLIMRLFSSSSLSIWIFISRFSINVINLPMELSISCFKAMYLKCNLLRSLDAGMNWDILSHRVFVRAFMY